MTSSNSTVNYPINYAKLSHLLSTIPNYQSSLSHLQFDTLEEIDHLDPSAAPLVHIIQSAFLQAIKVHDHLSLQTLLMKSPPLNGAQKYGALLINHHDPKTGLTAFHHAMRTKPLPSLDTITMLFQAGADMNAQTYYGRTALHHLARFGIDKDGRSWGIQKSNTSANGQPPLPPTLPANQQMTSSILHGGQVPQHLAMCASLLIRFGSLVNIPDPTGNTPLHFAAEFGGVYEVLEVLILEGGADLGVKNKKGLTPLDVCKTEDIKRRMMLLENERKSNNKTKSAISSLSGTIRPFDSASEYNRSSITRSVSRSVPSFSFLLQPPESKNQLLQQQKQQLTSPEEGTSDFHVILKAFFSYQTTFSDSIESSLAYITDSILGVWHINQDQNTNAIQQLEATIAQLRLELREAHEMFDTTDQLVEKVTKSFRKELEQVEQGHQADWGMSELQHDKIETLFDVFERIDGRFCQLELAQDDLIMQVERLRKVASRKQHTTQDIVDVGDCVAHLSQSLLILQTIPMDQILYKRDDRNRLYQDMSTVVSQVILEIKNVLNQETNSTKIKILKEAMTMVEQRWSTVSELLTKSSGDMTTAPVTSLVRSVSLPTTVRQKSKLLYKSLSENEPDLNQLELSFDIHHSNLYEIQKDIEDVTDHLEKLMASKKKMYELCLSLEKEMNDSTAKRSHQQIKSELDQVLLFTRQLLDKQQVLDKERNQFLKEYNEIEQQLDITRSSLQMVRPPALLQGLLDRLETDEAPCVRVEKDWKEDSNLVSEVIMEEQISSDSSSCSSEATNHEEVDQQLSALQLKQLNVQCNTKMSTLCYTSRLDASLYCLKVLASHLIGISRQNLLQVQAALGQASTDLDETRNQMTQLYDDAAEVARQVFALMAELQNIVRHRKEEVVKVWEVVDEVSKEVDAKAIERQQQQQQHKSSSALGALSSVGNAAQQRERIEEQDRHQWIIRELEQLQHVHESLQEAIEGLKQQQATIGQNLRQLATVYIEPQVDRLVGQNDSSLFSVSDKLTELMDRIRDNEIGLRPVSFWSPSSAIKREVEDNIQTTGSG